MSGNFVAATIDLLEIGASPPVTAVPVTVAAWLYPRTTTAQNTWVDFDDGSFIYALTGANDATANAVCVYGTQTLTTAAKYTVNNWHFHLIRFISAATAGPTLIWSSFLDAAGLITHTTGTANPTSVAAWTKIRMGGHSGATTTDAYDGYVGEFWYTNTDVYPSGGQPTDDFVRQLAYGGPFSVPHIQKDIVAYHSLRTNLDQTTQDRDVYWFRGNLSWTSNTNLVKLGPHPPARDGQQYVPLAPSPRTVIC